jgi:hypothetical protein
MEVKGLAMQYLERVVAGATGKGKGYDGRRADKEVEKNGMISIRAPSRGQAAAGSSGVGSASASPPTTRPTIGSVG